ncbi:MAG: twin-arginine translocase subunit TatB [Pseudomonadales bacterium]|nr:twin-arginine translocase subunit TatB [Pseudomonadales bacterium]
MFDIGFPELILVSIVALLVIGPDKLPETVRGIVLWIGRFRRSLTNLRMEIENEIGADEIRQQLHNESILKELGEAKDQLNAVIKDTESSLNTIRDSANDLNREVTDQIRPEPQQKAPIQQQPAATKDSDGTETRNP